MKYQSTMSEKAIRGNCSFFACRYCHTKFGWEHQEWCEYHLLLEPSCKDCRYYSTGRNECIHPAKKRREDLPNEEDTCSLSAGEST